MDEIINFNIKNCGPIDEANIDIGKINIIGGHNATGKSTASKLLYCFLKAGCNKRIDLAYDSLSASFISILNRMDKNYRYSRRMMDKDFIELLDEYEKLKEDYYDSNEKGQNKFMDKDFQDIDNFLKEIHENGDSLYLSILINLFKIEFNKGYLKEASVSFNDYDDENSFVPLNYVLSHSSDSIDLFKPKCYLNIYDVIYIDSISIFDLNRPSSRFRFRGGYYDHTGFLREMLRDSEDESISLFDEKRNESVILVEDKVNDILKGKFEYKKFGLNFISEEEGSEPVSILNLSSGIKQIGIIQLLLANRKLKEDSFLIIDEPEVNLHPAWQFKLAEILVLLAKELNIIVYVNTHSPMFIEAMEVFSDYYDLKDDTYYYLTEKSTKSSGYTFKYVDVDDLYELYNHLSKPYRYIESYRIKSRRKNKNND